MQVESKRYMKRMMTPLDGHNENLDFTELVFGNYFLETQLGCYLSEPSPVPPNTQLDLLQCPTSLNELCTFSSNSSSSNNSTSAVKSPFIYDMWIMYFEGSKTQEGSGVGFVSIDPLERTNLISSHMEFKCINNTTEYEALILGLQKAIDLNVVVLKVVGDSEIVVRQLCNIIYCISPCIKSYQQEVW